MSSTLPDKSNKPIFYVYCLLDTRKPGKHKYGTWSFDYEPFYVGKGNSVRWKTHFTTARTSDKSHKSNLIRKILQETGDLPKVILKKENLTEAEAFKLEKKLIHVIGRARLKEGPLTNQTEGGDGVVGRKQSLAERKLHAEVARDWNACLKGKAREDFLMRLSDGVTKSHATASAEQKVARSRAISQGLKNLSQKSQQSRLTKIERGFATYIANRTPEQVEGWRQTRKLARENLDLLVEAAANRKRSIASKAMHKNRSSKEKSRLRHIYADKRRQFWESKTEDERQVIFKKRSDTRELNRLMKLELLI